jgi:hypothetical protein
LGRGAVDAARLHARSPWETGQAQDRAARLAGFGLTAETDPAALGGSQPAHDPGRCRARGLGPLAAWEIDRATFTQMRGHFDLARRGGEPQSRVVAAGRARAAFERGRWPRGRRGLAHDHHLRLLPALACALHGLPSRRLAAARAEALGVPAAASAARRDCVATPLAARPGDVAVAGEGPGTGGRAAALGALAHPEAGAASRAVGDLAASVGQRYWRNDGLAGHRHLDREPAQCRQSEPGGGGPATFNVR